MPNKITNANPYVQLFLTLLFGGLIGLMTVAFVFSISSINEFQNYLNLTSPLHLLLVPVVLLIILIIKRNTLFFPTKLSELSNEVSSHYWSRAMLPINFLGPLLGHAAGLSLGREGAVVLFSSGLVRAFKLSWSFWGPVLATIGFSSVIGNYFVAPFFMSELFPATTQMQKVLGFLGAFTATIVGRVFNLQHLFKEIQFEDHIGFFAKIVLLLSFAISSGYIMRFYKWAHYKLNNFFSNSGLFFKIFVSAILASFLYLPEFRKFQSLGLSQFYDLNLFQGSYLSALFKLAFTLISTSLGFLGGEFVPLVYAGANWGAVFFHNFGHSSELGAAFGAFMFFAAGTRLKWTSFVLISSLLGWTWTLWIILVLSVAISFSGPQSLYRKFTSIDV